MWDNLATIRLPVRIRKKKFPAAMNSAFAPEAELDGNFPPEAATD
jgi:hypothetical protein